MSDQYDGPELTRQIYLRDRRIKALEQERDRLREALTHITHIGPLGVDTYPHCYKLIQECASAALAATGDKHD